MGFRCPACRTDFGVNQQALKDHLAKCELGRDLSSITLKATGDSQRQEQLGIQGHKVVAPVPNDK